MRKLLLLAAFFLTACGGENATGPSSRRKTTGTEKNKSKEAQKEKKAKSEMVTKEQKKNDSKLKGRKMIYSTFVGDVAFNFPGEHRVLKRFRKVDSRSSSLLIRKIRKIHGRSFFKGEVAFDGSEIPNVADDKVATFRIESVESHYKFLSELKRENRFSEVRFSGNIYIDNQSVKGFEELSNVSYEIGYMIKDAPDFYILKKGVLKDETGHDYRLAGVPGLRMANN